MVTHLVAIERALDTLTIEGEPGRRRRTTSPASKASPLNRIRTGTRRRTRKKSKCCVGRSLYSYLAVYGSQSL